MFGRAGMLELAQATEQSAKSLRMLSLCLAELALALAAERAGVDVERARHNVRHGTEEWKARAMAATLLHHGLQFPVAEIALLIKTDRSQVYRYLDHVADVRDTDDALDQWLDRVQRRFLEVLG